MRFCDVVGQETVKQYLRDCVNEHRLAHALLFSGLEGSGTLQMALATAQYLACQHRTEEDSCGECPTCRKMGRYVHADMRMFMPLPGASAFKGIEDAMFPFSQLLLERGYFTEMDWYESFGGQVRTQGIISVDMSEVLVESVLYPGYELPFKFVLIWLPERLHPFAANKLLKIIEEPPTETYFLLVTADEKRVLPTIRSRAQRIALPLLDEVSIANALETRYAAAREQAQSLASVAGGSMTEALSLLEMESVPPFLTLMKDLYRCALAVDYGRSFEWVKTVAAYSREQQKALLRYFSRMLREIFLVNLGLEQSVHLLGEELKFAKGAHPYINGRNVGYLLSEYSRALFEIGRNGNASAIFTDFALQHFIRMGLNKG